MNKNLDLKIIDDSQKAIIQAFSRIIEDIVDAFERKTLSRNELIARMDKTIDMYEMEAISKGSKRPDIQQYVFHRVATNLRGSNRQAGLESVGFLPDDPDEK